MSLHLGIGIRLGGQPGGASAAGPLLVNGDFSNGTTGWTMAQGGGTLTVVGGKGRVDPSSSFGIWVRSFPTNPGSTYSLVADISVPGAAPSYIGLRKSNDAGFSISTVDLYTNTGGVGGTALGGNFVATASTTYAAIQANGQPADFDNVTATFVS
jgi:hypothetical protein